MAKTESILAVDIGNDSLKIAEFVYPAEGGIILEKFAFAEYGGDLKEDELLESLSLSFKNTLSENGFKAKRVNLSISAQSSFLRFVKLPPVGEEESRVRQIVEYEAKQNVPFPIEEVIWDYQLIKSAETEAENEIEVVFVVVKNDLIKQMTQIIEDAGKEIALIEVAPTACFNSARANGIGESDCEMILNIGSRCSSLIFIDSGRFFVRTIPIAGYSITQQISKEFGIPFADAEEMKRRHGFVALGGAYEEPDSEVAATVSKIVRNVMTRLHGEINRSINVYRSQQKGKKPSKLWLTGGSSVMAFTPRFFSEKLRIPVDYFNAFQVVSLSPEIDKESLGDLAHMYSEVIGLGLRFITVCPIEISLIPESLKRLHELKQKIPYFYASAFSVLLCLAITFFGFSRQKKLEENRVEMAKTMVNKTTMLLTDVKNAIRDLQNSRKDYEHAQKIISERVNWVDLLNEIQNLLPDKVWLTQFKGSGSGTATSTHEADRPGPGSLFPVFGAPPKKSSPGSASFSKTSSEINWIQVEGHSLLERHSDSLEEQFKERLIKSPFFTNNIEEVKTVYFLPAMGDNNITSFKMEIKLKKPIRK